MTFLTLGGKCGGFGAFGLTALVVAADIIRPPSMDASAILPTPTPQRLKKWRRVSNCRSLCSGVISNLGCQISDVGCRMISRQTQALDLAQKIRRHPTSDIRHPFCSFPRHEIVQV